MCNTSSSDNSTINYKYTLACDIYVSYTHTYIHIRTYIRTFFTYIHTYINMLYITFARNIHTYVLRTWATYKDINLYVAS